MSKPPKIVIPGLNRGAGIPPGYTVGRRRGTGKGPAELLDLAQMRGEGLATAAQVTQGIDSLSTALSTTTDGLARLVLDGQDGEDGISIRGPAGAMGPQGPIGFGLDGQDGEDVWSIPRAGTAVQVTVVHELPMADGVTSFYRTDTPKSSWPLDTTVSSVAGTALNIATAIAQAAFEPAFMTGVSRIRIWNTTRNLSAWVEDAPTTSKFTVTSAADIAAWSAGDTVQISEPANDGTHILAIDIAPMMLATLGRVFRQAAISVRAGVITSSANSMGRIELWRAPISGSETIISGLTSDLLMGTLQNGCTALSPISNTNLLFIRDPTPTPVGISLISAFEITETITIMAF